MILAIHFHMCRLLAGLFGLVAIMASLGNSALATQSPWQGDPAIGEARLVSAVKTTVRLVMPPRTMRIVWAQMRTVPMMMANVFSTAVTMNTFSPVQALKYTVNKPMAP